jgi:hypothetical protein
VLARFELTPAAALDERKSAREWSADCSVLRIGIASRVVVGSVPIRATTGQNVVDDDGVCLVVEFEEYTPVADTEA